jgi:hypothetical protein
LGLLQQTTSPKAFPSCTACFVIILMYKVSMFTMLGCWGVRVQRLIGEIDGKVPPASYWPVCPLSASLLALQLQSSRAGPVTPPPSTLPSLPWVSIFLTIQSVSVTVPNFPPCWLTLPIHSPLVLLWFKVTGGECNLHGANEGWRWGGKAGWLLHDTVTPHLSPTHFQPATQPPSCLTAP